MSHNLGKNTDTRTHTLTHTRARARTLTHAHTVHTHTRSHTCTHTRTHTYSHARARTQTLTLTHTNLNTHTLTHMIFNIYCFSTVTVVTGTPLNGTWHRCSCLFVRQVVISVSPVSNNYGNPSSWRSADKCRRRNGRTEMAKVIGALRHYAKRVYMSRDWNEIRPIVFLCEISPCELLKALTCKISFNIKTFDICLTVNHWYKLYKHQLDATITVY